MASNQSPVVDRIRIIPRPDDFLDRNVGSSGEVFFNKTTNSLRVYSGALAGGYELVTADLANVTDAAILTKASTAGLAKLDLTNITDSTFLAKATQAGITASAGASIDVSESAPSTPSQGNIWLNSNTGALYVYITDVDSSQWIQPIVGISTGSGDNNQNAFSNFAVAGQTTIAADSTTDTVTLVAGSGMTITTNDATDTITFASSGGGGGGGIALTDLSITTGSANATPSLAYDNTTGVFTYTPPAISDFITASSAAALTNKTGNISQWTNDSNYLTSYAETDTLNSVTGRGATTTNDITVGDITADAYINAGSGAPTFTSASSITLTAPDGVIANGIPTPKFGGFLALAATPTFTLTGFSSVTQQSSGNYRLTFTTAYSAVTDYQVMATYQDFTSTVAVNTVIDRSTTHIDINLQRADTAAAVNVGTLLLFVYEIA